MILFMICGFYDFLIIFYGLVYDFFMASTRGGEATAPPAVGLQYFLTLEVGVWPAFSSGWDAKPPDSGLRSTSETAAGRPVSR